MQRSTKDQEIPSDGNFLDEPIRRNKNPRRTDKTCSPGISDRFRFFPLVGQSAGQQRFWQRPPFPSQRFAEWHKPLTSKGVTGGFLSVLARKSDVKRGIIPLWKNPVHPRMNRIFGASDVTRTRDLLITNQLHYRLCYTSIKLPSNYSISQL